MQQKIKLVNREISWLYFNDRVLKESADPRNPIIERIKFMGIFSNNLDEFFRVRVATLNRMLTVKSKKEGHVGFNPRIILRDIARIVTEQQKELRQNFEQVIKELEGYGILFVTEAGLTQEQGAFVRKYFRENVRPQLFPIMMKNFKSPETLKDLSTYLAIDLKMSAQPKVQDYALIKIPSTTVSRFLILPEEEGVVRFMFLDDVIRYCLGDIFQTYGYDSYQAYTIKFTRDAELDIDDDDVSKSLIELLTESLKQRSAGVPVRFIHDATMPEKLLNVVMRKLNFSKRDTIVKGGRYHNFKDLMKFPKIGPPQFLYPPTPPLIHKDLPINQSIFNIIRHKDIMLFFPYHSFQHVIDFLREASIDPHVREIKITLYRVATNSNVINALINAAQNGKIVTVFLELQARFDEEANIYWTQKLQNAGVEIIKAIPGFKVHSKVIHIRRYENKRFVEYANVATGNFNEETARIYTDFSLFTTDKSITAEVDKLFSLFRANYKPVRFNTLIVSPFSTRNFFTRLLSNEIRNAKEGKEAWAIIKTNNLADDKIVKKLYQASQAGVKIKLIVRGMCILVPGVKGLSENIEAISIVDRFLEHPRLFAFANNGSPLYYISSADWMLRNLDHRIEVTVPVKDLAIKQMLQDILEIQLKDNRKARIITGDGRHVYKTPADGESLVRSQTAIYEYICKNNE